MASPSAIPAPILACTAPFGFESDPAELIAAFGALGCRACQYYRKIPDPLDPLARRASVNVPAALAIARAAGAAYDSIHGVFGESLDPSCPDPTHRLACLRVYEDEAKLAIELGGPMVVVHPGAINNGKLFLSPQDAAHSQAARWSALDDFLARLAEVGEKIGVAFLIENLPFSCKTGFDPVELAEHVRRLRSRFIRMCFDTGHAHITVGTAACPSAPTVADAFLACADVVSYIHVHDNNRAADSHLVPGDGTLDWPAFSAALAASRSPATRMLELFHTPQDLARFTRGGLSGKLAAWLGV